MKQREAEIALQYAITNGRIEEVKILLAQGVDPNCFGEKSRNFKYAFTALCEAIAAAGREIADYSRDLRAVAHEFWDRPPPTQGELDRPRKVAVEIIRILLAAGADPSLATYSRTPLSLAVCDKDIESCETSARRRRQSEWRGVVASYQITQTQGQTRI